MLLICLSVTYNIHDLVIFIYELIIIEESCYLVENTSQTISNQNQSTVCLNFQNPEGKNKYRIISLRIFLISRYHTMTSQPRGGCLPGVIDLSAGLVDIPERLAQVQPRGWILCVLVELRLYHVGMLIVGAKRFCFGLNTQEVKTDCSRI